MTLDRYSIYSAIKNGGVWLLLVTKNELTEIILKLEAVKGPNMQVMEVDTVGDALKAEILIDLFNECTVGELRTMLNQHKKLIRNMDKM